METAPSARQGTTRAPFSFHCTICYDAFNLTDRAPVVLPCGHTYLCEPCSKRLDKCMECRTSLYTTVKKDNPYHHHHPPLDPSIDQYSRYGRAPRPRAGTMRSSYRNSNPSSPTFSPSSSQQPPAVAYEKKPLPIPKNHVLMCLIDAMQKSSEKENSMETDGYESGDDDEMVLRGMKVLGSSSGTYTVVERDGLIVYPKYPKSSKATPKSTGVKTLQYGQTVQITLFENKIASIARGAGYILVDDHAQLVKVGEVTDDACKLEATSRVIEMEIQALRQKTTRLKRALGTVNKKLHKTMSVNDENAVFGPVPQDKPFDEPPVEEELTTGDMNVPWRKASPPPSALESPKSILKYEPKKLSPAVLETQSFEESPISVFPCVPAIEPSRSFENLSNFLLGQTREQRESQNAMAHYFASYWSGSRDETDTTTCSHSTQSSSQNKNGNIDFRCGLSGHSGLNSGPRYNSHLRRSRKVRMMSQY